MRMSTTVFEPNTRFHKKTSAWASLWVIKTAANSA